MYQVTIPAIRANSLKEAFSLLEDGGKIINGGTDILVYAKEEELPYRHLVDITGIKELKNINVYGNKIVIGGAVTINEAMRNEIIKREFPVIVFAGNNFASTQIRNRATFAGNIVNASPAADAAAALYTCDALLQLKSPSGRREISLLDFIKGPRKTDIQETEIITGIVLPRKRGGKHKAAFIKIGQRKALAISKVMVAVSAIVSPKNVLNKIAIAIGAVAPVILRLSEIENLLVGKVITKELAETAKEIAMRTVTPIDDIRSTAEYRRKMAGVIVKRALLNLEQVEE